jgi:hypothetical protein
MPPGKHRHPAPAPEARRNSGISRREALRFLASASSLPLFEAALSHQPLTRLDEGPIWQPRFLDPEDVATVRSLSECIVPETRAPGAGGVPVHEYIDSALARAEPAVQTAFREGLSWLDRYASRSTGMRFIELARLEQLRLLAEISDTSRAHEPMGYAFLTQIKQLTIEGYYRPEAG